MAYLENGGKQAAEAFTVRSYECRPGEGMRPGAILRCFQELAIRHCALFGLPLSRMEALGVAFMINRVRLSIQKPPQPGDEVKATTWYRENQGVLLLRDTLLEDHNGSPLASCCAQWFLVRRESRSIMRLRDFKEYTVLLQPERALEKGRTPKLTLPESLDPIGLRPIRHTDIDHNGHLNNCIYADLIEDFFPFSLRGRRFSFLDLHFVSEALQGDTVHLFAGQEQEITYLRGIHERGLCFEAACTLNEGLPGASSEKCYKSTLPG